MLGTLEAPTYRGRFSPFARQNFGIGTKALGMHSFGLGMIEDLAGGLNVLLVCI